MLLKQLKLLALISKLVYPRYNEAWFIFYTIIKYQTIAKRLIKYYKFQIVNRQYLMQHSSSTGNRDLNNTVVVCGKNLYRNDEVLVLSDNKSTFRAVYVVPSSQETDFHTLYLSDCLYHNFNNSSDTVRLLNLSTELKYAEEINLSLITNNILQELGNTDGIIDKLIKSYFSKPKIVYNRDIIEINIKNDCPEVYYTNLKLNLTKIDNIYFKCNKILSSNLVVVGETAIKLNMNIQALLPKCVSNNTCPSGLEPYMTVVRRAVLPFIQKSIHLHPIFLLQGDRGCGKEILIEVLASQLGLHLCKINCCLDLCANIYAQIETKIHNVLFNAKLAAPCIVLMDNFENFGKNAEGHYDNRIINYFKSELRQLLTKNTFPIIVVCLVSEKNVLPPELKRVFLEIVEINAPTDNERVLMLESFIKTTKLGTDVDLISIANRTHGFYYEDLFALVYYAKKALHVVGNQDINEAFNKSIEFMQSSYNESLGAPKVPKVLWSDVGGLPDVKEEILKTINLPLKHPELLRKSGLKRAGILLFGPPGTGKTLIAKAVATQCALCFLSVKGPELLNMYVGQSEQNVREVFARARAASPCIIFFDELDSLAPNRGVSGDSGGVMDRVVSQLLAEIDGLNQEGTIFVIGATNRPDLIDPALLRPGRFDKLLYVGPCTDKPSKLSVLKALTRKFNLDADIGDLQQIVDICPENITGADFYGICSNAWTGAAKRLIESYSKAQADVIESLTDENVCVTFGDFELAIRNVKPSITTDDLKYFEKLRHELSSNR